LCGAADTGRGGRYCELRHTFLPTSQRGEIQLLRRLRLVDSAAAAVVFGGDRAVDGLSHPLPSPTDAVRPWAAELRACGRYFVFRGRRVDLSGVCRAATVLSVCR